MSWCPWPSASKRHSQIHHLVPQGFLQTVRYGWGLLHHLRLRRLVHVVSTFGFVQDISSLCKRAEIDRVEPLRRDSSVAVKQYPYFIPSSPVKPSNEETGASAQVSTEHNMSSWSDGIETSNQVTICYGWDLCRHFLLLRPLAWEMVCLMQDFFGLNNLEERVRENLEQPSIYFTHFGK